MQENARTGPASALGSPTEGLKATIRSRQTTRLRDIPCYLIDTRMDADSPCTIAIRLADEGVPVRAIARATNIPSAQLYETLTVARMDGRLLSLPRDDWPPGCPRDQRALQLSRLAAENRDSLMLAIQAIFCLTLQEARLLLLLLQHEQVSHARLDIDHGVLTVCTSAPCARHSCNIR